MTSGTTLQNRPGPLTRAVIFALGWCLGLKVILPAFLDTLPSILFLGFLPPFVARLVVGIMLDGQPGWRAITAPLAAIALAVPAIILVTPPPLLLLVPAVGAGAIASLVEIRTTLRYPIAFSVLTAILILAFYPRDVSRTRLLVLGIDAMDHGIVVDLVAENRMPHVQGLIERGAFCRFETEEPSFSPVLWTTIASGRGPEAHGVEGFYSTSEHVQVRRIWDILGEKGWTVGLFRWLVTWPPREDVNGFWIPDLLSRDSRAVPPGYGVINEFRGLVKGRLMGGSGGISARILLNYAWSYVRLGVRGSTILRIGRAAVSGSGNLSADTPQRYLFMRRVEMEIDCDLFLRLLGRFQPDFAAFYDNGIDMVGHRYWKREHGEGDDRTEDSTRRYGADIPRIYGWTDMVIGRILEEVDPSCHIVIVSDHGQKGIEEDVLDSWVVLGDEVLDALGLDRSIYVTTLGSCPYLFPVRRSDRDSVRSMVSAELERIRRKEGDLPLLAVGIDSSAGVPYLDIADRAISEDEVITLDGEAVPLFRFVTRYFTQTGTHDMDGVLVMSGPGIREGAVLDGTELRDLVPTLLYWEGLPVSREMDGKVLLSVFEPAGEIRYVDSCEPAIPEDLPEEVDVDPETRQRLRSLGYVD